MLSVNMFKALKLDYLGLRDELWCGVYKEEETMDPIPK